MKYTIEYTLDADNELAEVWLQANDRLLITRSMAMLERDLAFDPFAQGHARHSPLQRIAMFGYVGAFYEIIPDDYNVIIQGIFAI